MLEVGAGLGVSDARTSPRAAAVHAIELDRSLEPSLREALDGFANVDLVFADAMALDLAGLEPAPDKLVANLPYDSRRRSVSRASTACRASSFGA